MTNADSFAKSDANPDAYAHTYADADARVFSDADPDCDSYSDGYTYAVRDAFICPTRRSAA